MEEIQVILAKHPRLRSRLNGPLSSSRLGGLTNKNYLIETATEKFVLRIPGEGTQKYINRQFEEHAATVTAELGVNAPVLYFDAGTGVQLCRFIEKSVTMDASEFKRPKAIAKAAYSFRRVHESQVTFLNRFELFSMVDSYLDLLKGKKAELPEGFLHVKKEAESVRSALARHALPLAPCHCDPLAENFLETEDRMFLVDWEYSGNNDPMWDLGDLSVEAEFDSEQDECLLRSYFSGQEVQAFDRGRMILYKAMCDLLWTLWGIIQHADRNPADDFWAYSLKRFRRCQQLIESPAFAESLGAVFAGPVVHSEL